MNQFFNGLRAGLKVIIAQLLFFSNCISSPLNTWLECPPNVTITCEQSTADLDKWGKIWLWEDYVKKSGPSPKEILYNLNSCGLGEIIRIWEYTDKHFQILKCKQIITVLNAGTLFSEKDIIWPMNIELEGCNPASDPKDLPKLFNYPSFVKRSCSQPMYSYQDSKFTVADGCMKILRTWKVIDWCQYIPNSKTPVGLWTYTQLIKLIAKDSLTRLVCPKDTTIYSYADCNGTFINLDSVYGFSKCGVITKVTNNSPFSKNKGANASGYYPVGNTKFYFIGEYGCGKQISCEINIHVINKVSPTAYCLPGVIVALMPVDTNRDGTPDDGMIQVWAKDVDHGSSTKCSKSSISYSFSKDIKNTSRIFTCADLGKNPVELWITDSSGNYSFCKTYIEIQNNNANIPNCKRDSFKGGNSNLLNIAGLVTSTENKPVQDIQLSLTDLNSFTISQKIDTIIKIRIDTIKRHSGTVFYLQIRDTSFKITNDTLKASITSNLMNDIEGKFAFHNLIPQKVYKVGAKCAKDDLKGIDTEDAIILLRHLLGVVKISDIWNQIAADINQDGLISNLDFDLLYGVINGTKDIKSFSKRWCFVPKSKSPQNLSQIQEELVYQPLTKNVLNEDFYALKIGDINSSYVNKSGRDVTTRNSEQTLIGIVSEDNFIAGTTYTFSVQLNEIQTGLILNNILDGIDNLEVDKSWSFDPASHLLISLNEEGSKIINFKFKCTKNVSISDPQFQKLLKSSNLNPVQLISNLNDKSTFLLVDAKPNPLSDNSEFELNIIASQPDEFTFKLFDANGQFIFSKSKQLLEQFNHWTIPIDSYIPEGMYYYQITNGQKLIVGKLIKSK